ncbi:hypothetical protein GCM10010515_56410 [Streptomyces fructofermentans]|uniref:NADH dehydrogenase n=1 Tax=Streptomyces fructofermentans TaxID=152141 RepID=A0A918NMQ1_9ACTN|nr:hypothetical protein GCM10010515_56410 [Streptomyces fructofermentans]
MSQLRRLSGPECEAKRTEDVVREILVVGGGYAGFHTAGSAAWGLEELRRGRARGAVPAWFAAAPAQWSEERR